MSGERPIVSIPGLRDERAVFSGREDAGRVLAGMLEAYRGTDAVVVAIPSGGVLVGAAIADALGLPLEVAVVSKITPPWNTEVGYGAVAFDATVHIDDEMREHLGVTDDQVSAGVSATQQKVARRVRRFRGDRSMTVVSGRPVVLVDDGLASGVTMMVALAAIRRLGARMVAVAVPTGSPGRLKRVAEVADAVYCANVRGGWSFAVADAYLRWSDVDEDEAVRLYQARHMPGDGDGSSNGSPRG